MTGLASVPVVDIRWMACTPDSAVSPITALTDLRSLISSTGGLRDLRFGSIEGSDGAIVEIGWRDRAARDAWVDGGGDQTFRNDLSPYYKQVRDMATEVVSEGITDVASAASREDEDGTLLFVELATFEVMAEHVDEWIRRVPELIELYFPRDGARSYRILQSTENAGHLVFEVVWTSIEAHRAMEASEDAVEIHRRFDCLLVPGVGSLDYFRIA